MSRRAARLALYLVLLAAVAFLLAACGKQGGPPDSPLPIDGWYMREDGSVCRQARARFGLGKQLECRKSVLPRPSLLAPPR